MIRHHVFALALVMALAIPTAIGAQTPSRIAGARPPLPGVSAGVVAFVNVGLVPMDTNRALPNHTVLIEGGWVTALGPAAKVQVPAGALRIDGRGQYLMPGLADMHAHLFASSNPKGGLDLLLNYLAHGVTTIRNVAWDSPSGGAEKSLHLRAAAAAGTILSPRIYTGVRYVGTNTPADIAEQVAAFKAAGYDFIKVRAETLHVFTALTAAARQVGLPVLGHYPVDWAGNYKEVLPFEQVLASGMRSIEHIGPLPSLRDPAQWPARIVALRRAGVWVCPTLAVYGTFPLQDSLWKPLVKALHQDSGVGLLLGTDALDGGPAGVQEELKALVEAGLTPYQALVTGTRNVAAYWKTLNETGTLAVGKRADLVLLTGNPLADLAVLQRPVGTMLGGQWLPHAELEKRRAELRQSP